MVCPRRPWAKGRGSPRHACRQRTRSIRCLRRHQVQRAKSFTSSSVSSAGAQRNSMKWYPNGGGAGELRQRYGIAGQVEDDWGVGSGGLIRR
jgi:hypothetical protein